ncbi:hypothetical protein DRO91_05470 [Candidatus Heimdallarchaeota archaeon]|nr:MAG: hypothetical protein DRO63_06610 [Candidatus Gerdarchaeota archaeon]RLI71567.1 MAG: hypothetical protein DRO91_05470 [Candidatus Heimdallarchaeota archaeon]RLI72880.1 MAG: hypothetical protein DRP02_00465 [Candidatus Gerdarchaeota archaeon]
MFNIWFNLFVFPGMVFFIVLAAIFEHVNGRLMARFSFQAKEQAMFIPLVSNFKFLVAKEQEKHSFSFRIIVQITLLIVLLALPIFGAFFLPINILGELPAKSGGYGKYLKISEGVIGIFSFEGDVLLVFGVILLFGFVTLLLQLLSPQKLRKNAFKSYIQFAIWDIPLFLALSGFLIARKSLSLSLLAHDIRLIVDTNKLFGFLILLPMSTFIAIFSLSSKFDQPYFDRLGTQKDLLINPPLPFNWQLFLWNTAMRLQETLLAGLIVTLCLGGPHLPIPEPTNDYFALIAYSGNFVVKTMLVDVLITLLRAIRPRMRFDQTLNYVLKISTPFSLVSLMLIGLYVSIWPLA